MKVLKKTTLIPIFSACLISFLVVFGFSAAPINTLSLSQEVSSSRDSVGFSVDFFETWDILKSGRSNKEMAADIALMLSWSALAWWGKKKVKDEFGDEFSKWWEKVKD